MFKQDQSLDSIFYLTHTNSESLSPLFFQSNLTQNHTDLIHEIGVFTVDNAQGEIEEISPGQTGYTLAALNRANVVFSAVPRPQFPNLTVQRHLSFDPDTYIGFYLVKNSTKDAVLAGGDINTVVFAQTGANADNINYARVNNFSEQELTLAWEDYQGEINQPNSLDFNDLVMEIRYVETPPPPETVIQGKQELIDLRTQTGLIPATITVHSEAVYNNSFGFYQVDDLTGSIGNLRPGDPGYAAAAVRNQIDINQGLPSGGLIVPFFIANGTPEQFLQENEGNIGTEDAPVAYFIFLAANPDGVDHIRLLGDNTFAFEDLLGGGDRDYNDLIIQLTLETVSPPPLLPQPPDKIPPSPEKNKPPVNQIPSTQSIVQDTPLILTGDQGFRVSDPDAGNNPIQVTLTVTGGSVTLSQTEGLTVVEGNNSSDRIIVQGTIANLNTALEELTFTPNSGFTGTAKITITSDDLGNTGQGEAGQDRDTVEIEVNPTQTSVSYDFTTSSYSVIEGNSNQTSNIVTVVRTGNINVADTVNVVVTGGSAIVNNDFTVVSTPLNFAAGETRKRDYPF